YWDAMVALDVCETHEPDSTVYRRMHHALAEVVPMVNLQTAGSAEFFESVGYAQRLLRAVLQGFEASFDMGSLALIGHSHIDTAWLWPVRETRRKVARTWSTVLRLMERYPEFIFAASQPALYEFVKEDHPELWRQIRKRVKEGRWEPCGASYVEQDNNIPSGESLVRQFLYGNRFYEREFGARSRIAWLPDAFGFPWTLPQIMRRAQIETFHTIKIFWGRFTRFPFNLFFWQGADGSRVPTFLPYVNYNGNPIPSECIKQWRHFEQKHLVDEVPFTFGYGDGGGGPTKEMIEYGRRLKNIVGVPRCEFSRTQDCFDRVLSSETAEELPVHNGELYLEYHRGCQTTQARTKRNNRKCEFLLQNTELLSSLALLHGGAYDKKSIDAAWKLVLLNQFHDIL
ncbi:MAG TPA: alpha-mannosidase, partial [Candidatus Hydrogenedentes bacterium]|nr:alpha-mannosidase [Candidatus Hydrogenedentota bacterium]